MSTQWIDVSQPLCKGLAVWPGDTPLQISAAKRIAQGAHSNVSILTMSSHTGTHIDAPWHFEEDGKRLHEMDTSVFFGEALLLDYSLVDSVTTEGLEDTPLPPRVLFKTRNSKHPAAAPFDENYAALNGEVAQRLVDDGVRLVGIDGPSVGPFDEAQHEIHHRLLRNDVLVVEGLRLQGISAGTCRFVVLPLPVTDLDGAPCRAFIGKEAPA